MITASSVTVTKSRASNRLTDARGHRHLGVRARSVVDNDDDISEEKTIGIKLPGTAKLQSLVSSQAFKKFATNVKLRLTSVGSLKRKADEIFSHLKLKVDEDAFLKNPLLRTWMSYEKKLGTKSLNHALLLKLRERYDDAELANMLIVAKMAA
ncbi:hypothetical protein JG687_00016522, partial [Phytophthora cactorum]